VNLNTPLNLEGRLRISGAGISLFYYINMYLYLHLEEEYRNFETVSVNL